MTEPEIMTEPQINAQTDAQTDTEPAVDPQRQAQYYELIENLLRCPNGQEPEVLDARADLLDADLVKTIVQVAAYFAHHDNPDSSRFLVHIARELARQLGLYPETAGAET